jgi:hypothetical protein
MVTNELGHSWFNEVTLCSMRYAFFDFLSEYMKIEGGRGMKPRRLVICFFVLLVVVAVAISIAVADPKDIPPGQAKKIPEPPTLILLGIGLAGVGGYSILKFRRKKTNE